MHWVKLIRGLAPLLLGLMAGQLTAAGVTVNINSGNPRYPFPQFLSYGTGRNSLAQVNPVGVPHAELEQRIRDAHQIFANEWNYTGTTWAGVQYIDPFNPNGQPYDCIEGLGYALLAAAYMADKTSFDGLWMQLHDSRLKKKPRYSDCVIQNAGYLYGNTPADDPAGSGNSAADGDFDVALGILMAWYQWGDNMGVNDACGNPISYKNEAISMVNSLVEWSRRPDFPPADCRVDTGDVGFDGYFKGGNTWNEMTPWANGQCPIGPEYQGPTTQYFDYAAPAWFHSMALFLTAQGQPAFNITQLQRAEASSDWLMGQLYSQNARNIPNVANVDMSSGAPVFTNGNELGEDFRLGWRTILNYVWNGNPTTTWNPVTHQPVAGANTYERDMGLRFAAYLEDQRSAPWGRACRSFGGPSTYWGPPAMGSTPGLDGMGGPNFHLNRFMGTGAASAVVSQDFHLMAELFRECVTVWDGVEGTQQYLASYPKYMHGWFRQTGMMILSGNYLDPSDLVAPPGTTPANMKVYKAVNKTYAFTGDTVTYWINYRNYASTNANNVMVIDTLPAGLAYVSASPVPASTAGGVIRWNIGTVNGLQNQNYAATQGGITLTVQVTAANGRLCNTADVACSNGTGWTSNEYPNHKTATMERNCVDIIPAALSLTKTASPGLANPGDNVTFTIAYSNTPAPWLNGGRPGVVVSTGNDGVGASQTYLNLKFRVGHGADEALINYGNYRISYYVNDATLPTYNMTNPIFEGANPATTVFSQQNLIAGSDAFGAWNQRFMLQFPQQLAVPEPQLYDRYLSPSYIHEGALEPFRYRYQVSLPGPVANNWADDWSADAAATMGDGVAYDPISPDWTDPAALGVPVNYLHPHACTPSPYKVTRVLVEEWDGYTWRRVFGNGPVSGREMLNVQIIDTVPAGMVFGGFIGTAGVQAGNVLTWTLPRLRINESGQVKFWATLRNAAYFGGCPVNTTVTNTAQISATNESAVYSSASVSVTCNALPTPVPDFNKYGPAGPLASGANAVYVISYNAPSPLTSVSDSFGSNSIANWTNQQGAAGWNISGGVMAVASWGGGTLTHNGSSASNTTVTAHLSIPGYAYGGIVLRATAANTYYYAEVLTTNNGQSQIFFRKSVAGTVTTIQQTMANLAIPGATFFGLQVYANGSNFYVSYDTGGGWINPFGGAISDASIAGPGFSGLRTTNDPGYQATDFSATVDRISGVSIWDTTPANTSFQAGTPAPNSAPAVNGTGLVRWDLGTVVSGTNYSVTLTVKITGCPSQVVNQATLVGIGAVSNAVTTTVSCGTPTFTPATTPTRTASPTPSATRTASQTLTPTPSASPSATRSATPSATRSSTLTSTPSGTPSRTPSNTATPTLSPTPTYSITTLNTSTHTPTATPLATRTASASATPSATPSASPTASVTRSATPTDSPTRTATLTVTITPSPSSSGTPTLSSTRTLTASPTSTWTATTSPSPTVTITFWDTYTVSPTRSPTPTASPTHSASASPTPTWSPTATRTASATFTATLTASPTRTPTSSVTATPTVSPVASATSTPSISPSFTESPAFTATITPTASPSATVTLTATPSGSFTATGSVTYTPTPTATRTASGTLTVTGSATHTPTVTPTRTASPTPSASASATLTSTATLTRTPTRTFSHTATQSATRTGTPTASATPTISPTPSLSPTFSVSPTRVIAFYQQPELIRERGVYPNPFSDKVRLYFTLRVDAYTKLVIYNVAGEPIITKDYNGKFGANEMVWEGLNELGARCSSGVYIIHLMAEGVDGSAGGYWTNVVITR